MKKSKRILIIGLIILQICLIFNLLTFADVDINYGLTAQFISGTGLTINATQVIFSPSLDQFDVWIENGITELPLMESRLKQIINTQLVTYFEMVQNMLLDENVTPPEKITILFHDHLGADTLGYFVSGTIIEVNLSFLNDNWHGETINYGSGWHKIDEAQPTITHEYTHLLHKMVDLNQMPFIMEGVAKYIETKVGRNIQPLIDGYMNDFYRRSIPMAAHGSADYGKDYTIIKYIEENYGVNTIKTLFNYNYLHNTNYISGNSIKVAIGLNINDNASLTEFYKNWVISVFTMNFNSNPYAEIKYSPYVSMYYENPNSDNIYLFTTEGNTESVFRDLNNDGDYINDVISGKDENEGIHSWGTDWHLIRPISSTAEFTFEATDEDVKYIAIIANLGDEDVISSIKSIDYIENNNITITNLTSNNIIAISPIYTEFDNANLDSLEYCAQWSVKMVGSGEILDEKPVVEVTPTPTVTPTPIVTPIATVTPTQPSVIDEVYSEEPSIFIPTISPILISTPTPTPTLIATPTPTITPTPTPTVTPTPTKIPIIIPPPAAEKPISKSGGGGGGFMGPIVISEPSITPSITPTPIIPTPTIISTSKPNIKPTIIKLQIGNPVMNINGEEKLIDIGNQIVPVIQEDRTLLPIRFIVEEINGEIGWDGFDRKVTIVLNETTLFLWINSKSAVINGQVVQLDVAPVIINNRTYLPLRFIAESLGAVVDWDGETKNITINYGNQL